MNKEIRRLNKELEIIAQYAVTMAAPKLFKMNEEIKKLEAKLSKIEKKERKEAEKLLKETRNRLDNIMLMNENIEEE